MEHRDDAPSGQPDDGARASAWQPIETAPRDGTTMFVWWPHWYHFPLLAYVAHHQWHLPDSSQPVGEQHVDDDHGPTHWMPLPPAPVSRGEGGA